MRSELISTAVLRCVLKGGKLVILSLSKPTNVLIFRRVVISVSDREARSEIVRVVFALDPSPSSFQHARPPKLSAEQEDVLRPMYSAASRTMSRSVDLYFCFSGEAFCRRSRTFFFAVSSWNNMFCHFM